MSENKFYEVASCPHLIKNENIASEMREVIIAMVPALIAAFIFFGWESLRVILLSVSFCVINEYFFGKLILKKNSLKDLSAIVTGMLLAMNLPSNIEWWIILIGAFVAIVIGKLIFGGVGQNIFNPALLARVVLLISWPAQMTTWPVTRTVTGLKDLLSGFSEIFRQSSEAVTSASPLGKLAENGVSYIKGSAVYQDLFFGNVGGCLGEVSALALLIGGIYMLIRGQITWHIPVSFILTVFFLTGAAWIADDSRYADPLFHILSGGIMLGAIFMATDMVTSPLTNKGMLIFGFGCGLITVVIRLFGAYPEGVSFSILFMNAMTPVIDKYTKPVKYGIKNLGDSK